MVHLGPAASAPVPMTLNTNLIKKKKRSADVLSDLPNKPASSAAVITEDAVLKKAKTDKGTESDLTVEP